MTSPGRSNLSLFPLDNYMQLSTLLFLVFLFLVFVINFIFPRRFRWIWLLFASYAFCIYASPKNALVLLGVTAVTYLAGLLINKQNDRKKEETLSDPRYRIECGTSFCHEISQFFT